MKMIPHSKSAVRSAFLLLALASVAAGAQTLSYRRVEALGPPIPDGKSLTLALANSGWSVVQTEATNVTDPALYPKRYFFRSPEGGLTLIHVKPIPLNNLDSQAVISEDGRYAILGAEVGPVWIDRETGEMRPVPNFSYKGDPVAFVGNRVYLRGPFQDGLSVIDLGTGIRQEYPGPSDSTVRWSNPPERVTPDGKSALYNLRNAAVIVQDIVSGKMKTWESPGGGYTLDETGRYAWYAKKTQDGNGWMPVRHDLVRGTDETLDAVFKKNASLVKATGRFLFLATEESLVAEDTNATRDYYVYDRSKGTTSLLSTRPGSRSAMGEVSDLVVSPDGSRTTFNAFASDVSTTAVQLYARSATARNTVAAIKAESPAGGEGFDAVLSASGGAVLWERAEGDTVSLRSIVEGQPTLVVPLSKTVNLLDVSEDGTLALVVEQETQELHFYRNGKRTVLDIRGGMVKKGHIDSQTGIPVATVRRVVGDVPRVELLSFDPLRGTSRRFDEGALISDEGGNFSVAAGRAAWLTRNGVRVRDLTSGTSVDFAHTAGANHRTPRLTADGTQVSVADLDAQNNPLATRRYRLTDGTALSPTYFGDLTPDGKWVYDPSTAELVYLKTGARIPQGFADNLDVPGDPVGPEALFYSFNHTFWRYRVVAVPHPIAGLSAVALPGGKVRLMGAYRKAGLENANTWVEYRVDGTGEWKRMKTYQDAYTILKLSDGPHSIEARAVDAKGRVQPVPVRQVVVSDSVRPTFGEIKATPAGSTRYDVSLETTGTSGHLILVAPNGTEDDLGSIPADRGVIRWRVSFSGSGTHKFYFKVTDEASNEATSPKGTVTIE